MKTNLLVVVLIILVLGLGAFIIYTGNLLLEKEDRLVTNTSVAPASDLPSGFFLGQPQPEIKVGKKPRQNWQLISRAFTGQALDVIGVVYHQDVPGEELTIKRANNAGYSDNLPSLWDDTFDELKGEPVCAIVSGNYDSTFRSGKDICEEFLKEFMEQDSDLDPVAINLAPGKEIASNTEFRLTWQRGWGAASNEPFRIYDLQFVHYNPD